MVSLVQELRNILLDRISRAEGKVVQCTLLVDFQGLNTSSGLDALPHVRAVAQLERELYPASAGEEVFAVNVSDNARAWDQFALALGAGAKLRSTVASAG